MPDDTKDFQAFLDEYGELVKKHKIDFATYPMYVPDQAGAFHTVIRNTPVRVPDKVEDPEGVKSPFVE